MNKFPDLKNIPIKIEEENLIKSKAIDSIPLNPTALGWTGTKIRNRFANSITHGDSSLLYYIKEKLNFVKNTIDSVILEMSARNTIAKWHYGVLIDENKLTSFDSELEGVELNDIYLNVSTGALYMCYYKDTEENQKSFWEFIMYISSENVTADEINILRNNLVALEERILILESMPEGKDGVGIETMNINSSGELLVEFSNGETKNLGVIKGADGKDGKDGEDGTKIIFSATEPEEKKPNTIWVKPKN